MGDGNLLYVTFNWPEIMRKNIERLQDLTRDQNMKQVSQTGFSNRFLRTYAFVHESDTNFRTFGKFRSAVPFPTGPGRRTD